MNYAYVRTVYRIRANILDYPALTVTNGFRLLIGTAVGHQTTYAILHNSIRWG